MTRYDSTSSGNDATGRHEPATFVVTGCAGFIGSHVVEALLERGDAVRGIDSFTDYYARGLKQANLAACTRDPSFMFIEADLCDAQLDDLVDGAAGVFHLAAQAGVRGSWGDTFAVYAQDNIVATQRLLEAAVGAGSRVAFASSSSVYGDAEAYPTREDAPPHPISPYGVTKLCCEHLAGAYADSRGLDHVILRYFTVYGPRQRPDMAFARIVRALVDGGTFSVFGTGGQTRDVTFVGDAVAATIAAMDRGQRGAIYNVGGGSETSLRDAIEIAERLSGRRLDAHHESVATGDVGRTAADTSRARRDLDWKPRTSIEEGLRQQLAWAGIDAAAAAEGSRAGSPPS